MFSINDIVISNNHRYSMGCEKSFAKITKITKTGRFRAQHLGKKIVKNGNVDGNYCVSNQVMPVINTKMTDAFLIQSTGKYDGNEYEKYDPTKEYYDILDSWR
jgi:hypothetical protein